MPSSSSGRVEADLDVSVPSNHPWYVTVSELAGADRASRALQAARSDGVTLRPDLCLLVTLGGFSELCALRSLGETQMGRTDFVRFRSSWGSRRDVPQPPQEQQQRTQTEQVVGPMTDAQWTALTVIFGRNTP